MYTFYFILRGVAIFIGRKTTARAIIGYYVAVMLRNDEL